MKILWWFLGCMVLVCAGFVGLQITASERVEVVVIYTQDNTGQEHMTRLWIVDYQGNPYLRSGSDQASWYAHIVANPVIKMDRQHHTHRYKAIPESALQTEINELMQLKYTWGDTYIGFVFGRKDAIPIRLVKV